MPRTSHGIPAVRTQEEIAALCGVSQPRVSKWLTGRAWPTPENLVLLAGALGMSPQSLTGYLLRERERRRSRKKSRTPGLA